MKKFFPALAFAALLSACCSNSPISSEPVQFQSEPEGAQVLINGELRGTTPCEISLSTKSTHSVVMKKDGFKDEAFVISTSSSNPLVKIGPLDELGFYRVLTPNPAKAELVPLKAKQAPKK